MKKIFVTTLIGLCVFEGAAFAKATAISDSLVNNLSCSSLSVASILGKIRPDAFSHTNHMPLRNWGFRSGAANIAACWGMGSTQRKLFYLMRLNDKNAPPADTKAVLDMVRGATIDSRRFLQDTPSEVLSKEKVFTDYRVIPVTEQSLREEYYHNTGASFMDLLFRGIDDRIDSNSVHRDLRTEIERSQELHFYRAKNIEMGAGSGPRDTKTNQQTLKDLINNIRANRLTLINLRLKMRVQHIVIPKSYTQDAKGNVWIQAYDSNQPETDHKIYYSKDTGHFYSPEIMGAFTGDSSGTDFTHPLGVFIVDEAERTYIEAGLLRHYQARCK